MKFIAEIDVMPHKELLDPQGKTVANNMKNLHLAGIEDVRIGKHIKMTLDAASEAEATEKVETACKKLLANVIMETYSFSVKQA
ncbi:MAG: phosphoribosylformylglycinamidine synthase subunit PurS [Saprospiraceae bacterium]|nr:phosphoribosylformylglycinamidine synthase subunit PurS [Saprospiraceae bacterium]MCB0624859.1 phosphoribosylformylglycinamidine synthase subunit PurS [Saprospiraceae bacterium]MCB0677114.1 phosphoribosylformylglycinamidine synthase subunit PurS [Saprospiraceae bacterium]MCB0679924.1 phosphoribosylformylglycinamidine synthase subunit PurS [Saprospiraceae bacterium]